MFDVQTAAREPAAPEKPAAVAPATPQPGPGPIGPRELVILRLLARTARMTLRQLACAVEDFLPRRGAKPPAAGYRHGESSYDPLAPLRRSLVRLCRRRYLVQVAGGIQYLVDQTTGRYRGTQVAYGLREEGAKFLVANDPGADLAIRRLSGRRLGKTHGEIRPHQLAHDLAIADVLVALLRAPRRDSAYRDVELYQWWQRDVAQVFSTTPLVLPEGLSRRDQPAAYEAARRQWLAALELVSTGADAAAAHRWVLVPDALLTLRRHGKIRRFALEVDRGTMVLERVAEKLAAYQTFFRLGLHTARWGNQHFTVLFVAPTAARRDSLRAAARAVLLPGLPAGFFRFSAASDWSLAAPERILAAEVWRMVDDTLRLDLLR